MPKYPPLFQPRLRACVTELSNNEEALRLIHEAKEQQLTQLDLSCLNLSRLPAEIAALSNLTTLYLNDNQIVDVSPLAGLTKLMFLFLGYNQIVDVRPLAALSNLMRLYLNDNQIVDLQPLLKLLENIQV